MAQTSDVEVNEVKKHSVCQTCTHTHAQKLCVSEEMVPVGKSPLK